MRALIGFLQKIESGLLAVILFLLIVLAAWQVLARNFFDGGLLWGDGFVRVAVLWVTLIGAMVASRTDDHIRMDVITRYLPGGLQRLSARFTAVFTAVVCALFSWFSTSFVAEEMEYGTLAFGEVPAWICALVMPVGFGVMALRYVLHAIVLPDKSDPTADLTDAEATNIDATNTGATNIGATGMVSGQADGAADEEAASAKVAPSGNLIDEAHDRGRQ